MIIGHPATIILASIVALIATIKYDRPFQLISIAAPILGLVFLYYLPVREYVYISRLTLVYEGSFYNKLIGFAFLIALLAANLYSLGQGRKMDLVLGNAYAAFALFCLFAGDFLSMFVCLELMMVVSSIIIFIGGRRASLRSAKKYFLTHLMSSNMIIIGIVHIISKNGSIEIVNAATLMGNASYSQLMIFIMLVGMLINVAAFPFAGWMVNYYPKATTSGFLYLISFTTKVSVVLLVKIFAGLEALKYVAALMILYSAAKVVFEDNILSLLCYLSILAMGLMLMGISVGSPEALHAVICYLFLHILYKSLLSVCSASIINSTGFVECSNLVKTNNKLINIGLVVGVALMASIPGTAALSIKTAISYLFAGGITYLVTLVLGFVVVFALPWQQYFHAGTAKNIQLNIYTKASILILATFSGLIAIFGNRLLYWYKDLSFEEIKLFSSSNLMQLFLICAAVFLAFKYGRNRFMTRPINLTEWLGDVLFYLYSSWYRYKSGKEQNLEPWVISSLENQARTKLSIIHNQQTAIFIVFIVFLVMLLMLSL
ncbi:MAG: proton-conducting transporter membrane subunit [Rickettsiaceae bacterium]